jgi:ketosteroid isomerase-like protein
MHHLARAMLKEVSGDIDLVRWLTVAYNRGDLDTLREHYASDIVVDAGELWPALGAVHGVDRVLAEFASIFGTFERVEVIADDYLERGGAVVVPSRWCGTMSGSDSVIEQAVTVVYRVHDGHVTSIQYFTDLAAALAAADGTPPSAARAYHGDLAG